MTVVTVTYDELFGREPGFAKEEAKRLARQAKKREKQEIRKLKAARDDMYVQLIVAYGLAFKAKTVVRQACWLAGQRYAEKPKRKKNLNVTELKRAGRTVHRRAKKILAKEGVRLRIRHSLYEGEHLLSLHCD